MSVALGAWPIPQSLGSQAGTSLKICQPATSPVNPPGKHHERRGSLLGFVEAPFRCIYCIYIISYHIISYHIDSYWFIWSISRCNIPLWFHDYSIIMSLWKSLLHCLLVEFTGWILISFQKTCFEQRKNSAEFCWVYHPKKMPECVCVSPSFSGQNSFVYDIFMTFLVSLCRNTRECFMWHFCGALPFPVSPAQWELRQEVLIPQFQGLAPVCTCYPSPVSRIWLWSPLFGGSAFSQLFSYQYQCYQWF